MVHALFDEEVDILEARDGLRPGLFLPDLIHPFLQLDEPRGHRGISPNGEADLRERLETLTGHLLVIGARGSAAVRHVEDLRRRTIVRFDEMVHALFAGDLDHARIPQLADVMVDRLRRQVQFPRDLAHGHLLRSKEIDDPPSGLVPQQLKRLGVFDELECLRSGLGTMYVCGCL